MSTNLAPTAPLTDMNSKFPTSTPTGDVPTFPVAEINDSDGPALALEVTGSDFQPGSAEDYPRRPPSEPRAEIPRKTNEDFPPFNGPESDVPPPPIPRDLVVAQAPQIIGEQDDLWRNANELAKTFVHGECEAMDGSLDSLLIFAGLFSAVNSGLLAISLPSLSAPLSNDTNLLLRQLVTQNMTLPEEVVFVPPRYAVRDNILFSTSLGFSLFAAFAAVSGKQWIVYYRSIDVAISEKREARDRQAKIEGAERWRLRIILEILVPSLLQISLALFAIGMVDMFWNMNAELGIWNAAISSIGSGVFIATIVLAIKDPKCPFQTPISTMVYPALCASLPSEIPVWLQTGLPDDEPKRYRWIPFFRGLPRVGVRRWSLPSVLKRSLPPTPSNEEAVHNSVVFTLEKADDPATTLAAIATIPSITSRSHTRKLAADIEPDVLKQLSAALMRLGTEESVGFQPNTVKQAALYARAALHFFISSPYDAHPTPSRRGLRTTHPDMPVEWKTWWGEVKKTLTQPNLEETEIQYLKTSAVRKVGVRHPPSAVHLAALLRLFIDHLNYDKQGEPKNEAAAFAVAATASLVHSVPWGSVTMSVRGVQLIAKRASEYFKIWRAEHDLRGDCLTSLVSHSSPIRNKDNDVEMVWRLYNDSSTSSGRVVDWQNVYDVFDGYSRELDMYLGKPPEFWSRLVRSLNTFKKVGQLRGTGNYHGPSSTIGALVRRLIDVQEQNPTDERTDLILRAVAKEFRTSYDLETNALVPCGLPGSDWVMLNELACRNSQSLRWGNSDLLRYSAIITRMGLDLQPGEEHQHNLASYNDVVEGLSHVLSLEPITYGDATLWLLNSQAERWFGHNDESIHARFLNAKAPTGIVRVLAYDLARPPYPGATEVLEKVAPLISVLLKRDEWVRDLLAAFLQESILRTLVEGSNLAGGKAPQRVETDMRSEVSRLISYAGISLLFAKRFGYPMEVAPGFMKTDDGMISDVWALKGTVAAALQCIEQSNFGPEDLIQLPGGQKLDDIFRTYAKALRMSAASEHRAGGSVDNSAKEVEVLPEAIVYTGPTDEAETLETGNTETRQWNAQRATVLEAYAVSIEQALKQWKIRWHVLPSDI